LLTKKIQNLKMQQKHSIQGSQHLAEGQVLRYVIGKF
jgi:hypothetical protein